MKRNASFCKIERRRFLQETGAKYELIWRRSNKKNIKCFAPLTSNTVTCQQQTQMQIQTKHKYIYRTKYNINKNTVNYNYWHKYIMIWITKIIYMFLFCHGDDCTWRRWIFRLRFLWTIWTLRSGAGFCIGEALDRGGFLQRWIFVAQISRELS